MTNDYIRREDVTKMLDELRDELTSGTDKRSVANGFVISIIGIIKCKIMQMGEKREEQNMDILSLITALLLGTIKLACSAMGR